MSIFMRQSCLNKIIFTYKKRFFAEIFFYQMLNKISHPRFIRSIQDWELESLQSFFAFLYSTNIGLNGVDIMVWLPASNGSSKVKSYFKVLMAKGCWSFPWKCIWKVKAPSEVSFFTWTVAMGRILTLDNLKKRSMCC